MDVISRSLREELVPGLRESLPGIDPVMGRLCTTSQNVVRENIGRDWKVIHTFDNTGVTGLSYTVSPSGGAVLADGSPGNVGYSLFGGSQMTQWPTADKMPGNSYLQRTITLKKNIASCPIPITLTQTDQLEASIGPMVNSILKGFVRNILLMKLGAFWKLNADHRIAEATAGATSIGTSGTTFTLTAGRVANLYNGMAVYVRQIASAGAAAQTTANTGESEDYPAFVDSVDYRARTFKIRRHPSGSATDISGLTSGGLCAIFRYRPNHSTDANPVTAGNAYSMSGLEDWLVDDASSTVFGIDFSKYKQFRSWRDSTFSGALDSTALNKMFGGFMEAYGADMVDTLVTTDGVWLGLVDNIESTQQLLRYESQGKALDIKLGTQGKLKYLFNGKELEVIQTKHCPKGTVYGLKLGNGNIKHYVPPPLPKKGSMKEMSQEVEFIGPAIGYPGIVVPLPASATNTATTDGTHLPAQFYCEVVPDQLQGIKMSTFSENI